MDWPESVVAAKLQRGRFAIMLLLKYIGECSWLGRDSSMETIQKGFSQPPACRRKHPGYGCGDYVDKICALYIEKTDPGQVRESAVRS